MIGVRNEIKRGTLAVVPVLAAVGLLAIPSSARAADEVTFTKDIAPILQKSCQSCHRPGSVAPMSLLNWEDARPWARSIKAKVQARQMPPWNIDKTVGIQKFKEDRSLSDADIAKIAKWADAGAPRGNPADMPPPLQFKDDVYEWTIEHAMGRPPDLIIPLPEENTVEPGNANQWIDFVSESGLTEDRWVRAYETKPSLTGFPVVHHATTMAYVPGGESEFSEEGFSTEYALGKTGDIYPEGTGRMVKAGSKVRFNMHYASNPNGKPTKDRTKLALWFYPKGFQPEHVLIRRSMGGATDLDLPAGDNNVRVDGYTFLEKNTRLTVYQPHLHNLGKRQCMEAIYTDGRRQILSCVNWDFGWHIAYNYADDVQPLLPKGTVLHIISWHDNSKENKWNLDPKNWIGWGNRSTDEMSFAHVSFFELTDEEYAQAVRERLAAHSSNNNNN